jgi:CBS domain containing-hemolysin-like protein
VSGPLGLSLALLLIVLNGLFVAAEFSLVSLRRPAVDERVATGDRRARSVVRELGALSFTLSAAQFGITATSLLLGFIAERAIGDTVVRPTLELLGLPVTTAASITAATAIAFLLSTLLQMLLGELFPKNLAISRPLSVALTVVPFTRVFGIVLGPVIRVFDLSAEWVTRRVFKVEVAQELEGGHSLDELARIVAASGEEGSLSEGQTTLLRRAIELGELRAGRVMVPRPDIVWLDADHHLADLRVRSRETGHSRFPVRGVSEDEVLGTVHVKDLLGRDLDAQATTPVTAVVQAPLIVPESQPLRRLLADLRRQHRTFAVVVDEFGGTAGIVTVEDVLEVLVGDIRDEFDPQAADVRRLGAGRHTVRGALRIEQLEDLLGLVLPEGPYETVAGFVLDQLGRIPEPGDLVTYDEVEMQVTGVEGVRVTELTLTARPPTSAPEEGPA